MFPHFNNLFIFSFQTQIKLTRDVCYAQTFSSAPPSLIYGRVTVGWKSLPRVSLGIWVWVKARWGSQRIAGPGHARWFLCLAIGLICLTGTSKPWVCFDDPSIGERVVYWVGSANQLGCSGYTADEILYHNVKTVNFKGQPLSPCSMLSLGYGQVVQDLNLGHSTVSLSICIPPPMLKREHEGSFTDWFQVVQHFVHNRMAMTQEAHPKTTVCLD